MYYDIFQIPLLKGIENTLISLEKKKAYAFRGAIFLILPFGVVIAFCFLVYSICAITPLTIIDVSSGRNWHILTSALSEFISVLAFSCNSTVNVFEVMSVIFIIFIMS